MSQHGLSILMFSAAFKLCYVDTLWSISLHVRCFWHATFAMWTLCGRFLCTFGAFGKTTFAMWTLALWSILCTFKAFGKTTFSLWTKCGRSLCRRLKGDSMIFYWNYVESLFSLDSSWQEPTRDSKGRNNNESNLPRNHT